MMTLSHGGKTYQNWEVSDLLDEGVPAEAIVLALHAELSIDIDRAAGKARAAFVSPGELVDQEYQLAKREANEWLEAGSDADNVPTCVQDHVEMYDVSAEEAAATIVATAEAWETAMREIRTLRLAGKTAVRKADTIEDAEQAAKDAIAQLKAYRP